MISHCGMLKFQPALGRLQTGELTGYGRPTEIEQSIRRYEEFETTITCHSDEQGQKACGQRTTVIDRMTSDKKPFKGYMQMSLTSLTIIISHVQQPVSSHIPAI